MRNEMTTLFQNKFFDAKELGGHSVHVTVNLPSQVHDMNTEACFKMCLSAGRALNSSCVPFLDGLHTISRFRD
jgi:hypothetical protein